MRSFIAGFVLLSALSGCFSFEAIGDDGGDCEESACEAAQAPRRSGTIEQGVVGVIAYRTDACEQSCCACEFKHAELWLLPVDAPVTSEGEALAAVAQGSSSGMTLDVRGAYEQALDPGDYLLCYRNTCAALQVHAGDVFTVNFQLRYGPPSVIVFALKDTHQRDDLVFETNKE